MYQTALADTDLQYQKTIPKTKNNYIITTKLKNKTFYKYEIYNLKLMVTNTFF